MIGNMIGHIYYPNEETRASKERYANFINQFLKGKTEGKETLTEE